MVEAEARAHTRSSGLLLVGRLLATAANFAAQVAIVRHLDKAGYGAFAYGLAIAATGESVATLGLDRGVTRFVPMYEEQHQPAKAFGVLLFVAGSITALAGAVVATLLVAGDAVTGSFHGSARAAVLVLVVLVPVQALDNLLVGLFAVFDRPRAIFFRRYVVAPGLRLAVVALVVAGDGNERALAVGYVLTGAAGVAVYTAVLLRGLARSGRIATWRRARPDVPVRSVLGFTVPLLTTDVVQLLVSSLAVLLLGRRGEAAEAADLRAVQPVANLNQLALLSFGVLFTPLVSRLHARGDLAGVGALYRRTAATVAVLTFPVFLATVPLAHPLVVALFGERYRGAGTVLLLVAAAQFVNAVLGFNNVTLAVLGRVRQLVVINLVTIAVNVVLSVALVPSHGALGGAVAMALAIVVVNVLRQLDLRRCGIGVADRSYAPVYALMGLGAAAVGALELVVDPPLAVGLAAAAGLTLAVLVASRSSLDLAGTFPELGRLPVLGRLVR